MSADRDFVCWVPDLGEDGPDDGVTVRASSEEDAAIARAHDHFWADASDHHQLLSGGMSVFVSADPLRAMTRVFHVHGEASIDWRASERDDCGPATRRVIMSGAG